MNKNEILSICYAKLILQLPFIAVMSSKRKLIYCNEILQIRGNSIYENTSYLKC